MIRATCENCDRPIHYSGGLDLTWLHDHSNARECHQPDIAVPQDGSVSQVHPDIQRIIDAFRL